MTKVDPETLYVVVGVDGHIKGVDTDILDALDLAWSHGLGYTAVPLSRLIANSMVGVVPSFFTRAHNKFNDAIAPDSMTVGNFKLRYKSLGGFYTGGQKIQAIKETRSGTFLGLADAKAYCDWFWMESAKNSLP